MGGRQHSDVAKMQRKFKTTEENNVSGAFPKDSPGRRAETRSFQILFPKFNADRWDFLGRDHHDHGVDYTFEYIEDGEYKGHRILAQIKGRSSLKDGKNGYIAFPIPVITANYAVCCKTPFVLFLVDLQSQIAYYLPLQDYFIANKERYERLSANKSSITVYIPVDNIVGEEDSDLIAISKSGYFFDEKQDKPIKIGG